MPRDDSKIVPQKPAICGYNNVCAWVGWANQEAPRCVYVVCVCGERERNGKGRQGRAYTCRDSAILILQAAPVLWAAGIGGFAGRI